MIDASPTDAQRVRQFRAHYGLSQIELARLLDVTRQTIYVWEAGKQPMTRIARYALFHLDRKLSEPRAPAAWTQPQHGVIPAADIERED